MKITALLIYCTWHIVPFWFSFFLHHETLSSSTIIFPVSFYSTENFLWLYGHTNKILCFHSFHPIRPTIHQKLFQWKWWWGGWYKILFNGAHCKNQSWIKQKFFSCFSPNYNNRRQYVAFTQWKLHKMNSGLMNYLSHWINYKHMSITWHLPSDKLYSVFILHSTFNKSQCYQDWCSVINESNIIIVTK